MLLHRFKTTNLRIHSEYRKIRTRKNSVFGHFSRSGGYSEKLTFEIEGETSSGTTHHLVKMLRPISRNNFYTYWINILVEIINITKSSIVTMSELVIVSWII